MPSIRSPVSQAAAQACTAHGAQADPRATTHVTWPCFILRVRAHTAQASPATVLSLFFPFPFSISTLVGEGFRSLKMPRTGHPESSNIARDGIKPPADSR